jgi:hypothetical protein
MLGDLYVQRVCFPGLVGPEVYDHDDLAWLHFHRGPQRAAACAWGGTTPSETALVSIVPDLLYMGTFAGVFSILFWNIGNRILSPLNGVLFMDILPMTTFTVSALTGLIPARMQIAGACMTGTALILNNLYLRRRARSRA